MPLSSRNCKRLCAAFETPTRGDIDWDDFKALVEALGGGWPKMGSSSGSRRRALLRGVSAVFHRPHPGNEMKKGSVESAREFLENAGATPQSEGCRC